MPPVCPQTMDLDLLATFFLCRPHTHTLSLSLSVCHTKKKKKRLFWLPRVFCHLIPRTKAQANSP